MGELKPKGGHGSGAGQLHLVRHTSGPVTRRSLRQEIISYMPNVSSIEKRQEVKKALNGYLNKAVEFVSVGLKIMKKDREWAKDIEIVLAIELYIMDKLRECSEIVSKTANPMLFDEFLRVASAASFGSRMLHYEANDAKRSFDDLSLGVERLCRTCGVQNLGIEMEGVLREYLPYVRKLSE